MKEKESIFLKSPPPWAWLSSTTVSNKKMKQSRSSIETKNRKNKLKRDWEKSTCNHKNKRKHNFKKFAALILARWNLHLELPVDEKEEYI